MVNVIWFMPFDIDDFYERTLIEYAIERPETLTKFQIGKNYGVQLYNDKLTDLSAQSDSSQYVYLVKQLEMLHSYKRSKQTARQLVSTEVLENFLENQMLEHSIYKNYAYPIDHINGAHLELPFFLATQHPIQSHGDAKDYIKRLNHVELYFK